MTTLDSIREGVRAIEDVLTGETLLSFLGSTEAKNRAEIRAQCSPEYGEYRAAKDLSEQIKQLVITCRGYLRSIDEEARLAR
jgi:hypothetical protein